MLEDKLLIWKFKGGSSEALCRIYRKYGDYLLALAAALLQDVNASEDVVHDVFCKFIESREAFRLAGSLKSFLATCVVNLARDKLRAKKLQLRDLDEASAMVLDTNEPDQDAIFGEQARDLNRAMATLAYEQREVILLHIRGGMKFREIAGLQGISINTTKSRYRYGLQKLRTFLSDQEKENEINQRHKTIN
ncbi:MAG: sigma-70 family RNA polymerase sigma factor [Sedimentisphaerales bacterium]|nr:sigma-70 family RNA polymerase sigma factor [Sedimentisphaerales bacterium]